MTTFRNRAIRRAGLALAFAISVSALSSNSGLAFTMEAQQMCSGDAFRLCSSEIPNIPRITACMVRHRRDLSPGCRAVMEREAAQRRANRLAVE
jgi:hypothetical protein